MGAVWLVWAGAPGGLPFARTETAWFKKSAKISAGKPPPVTLPIGLLSSLPSQTPTVSSGVNPMNQASR